MGSATAAHDTQPSQKAQVFVQETKEANSDCIVCALRTVSLAEEPSYTALSYCWGDQTQREMVQVNDRKASVTTNLKQALEALRKDREDLVLWVDALVSTRQIWRRRQNK